MILRALCLCFVFCASALYNTTGAARSLCFPRAYGPENNPICVSWSPVSGDVLFKVQCVPDSFPEFSLSWCAIGFSTAAPPDAPVPQPGSWGMWPAEVVHLQVLNASSGTLSVVLTDRMTTGVKLPACAPAQATRLVNASVDSGSGVLTAFFVRAARLSSTLLSQGYTDLNRTLPLVAAISNAGPQNMSGCDSIFPCHDNEWRNETADFRF